MIFGDCPYCGHPIMIGVPDGVKLPVMSKVECDGCGKTFAEKISRIDPEAYKLEDVEIDEEKKIIKLKAPPKDKDKA